MYNVIVMPQNIINVILRLFQMKKVMTNVVSYPWEMCWKEAKDAGRVPRKNAHAAVHRGIAVKVKMFNIYTKMHPRK